MWKGSQSVTLDFMTENRISVQWMTNKEITMVSVMTQCRPMDENQEKWRIIWLEEQLAFVTPV